MMQRTDSGLDSRDFLRAYWVSLRYFGCYRLVVALLLVLTLRYELPVFDFSGAVRFDAMAYLAMPYFLLTAVSLATAWGWPHRFNGQLSVMVLLDVLMFSLLLHLGGGLRTGLGMMLLVSLAAAGLIGQGRVVLFYAALATLSVLAHQVLDAWHLATFNSAEFMQAGLVSAGFFASAVTARLLARRVVANERLAYERGLALRSQIQLSQRIIEDMQDGVLVLDADALLRQWNPQAGSLLGLQAEHAGLPLAEVSPLLAREFVEWQLSGRREGWVSFTATRTGRTLRARCVRTASGSDGLLFIEDMERIQAQAQQLKLAALGRLTANIAHEIRNPLSAIRHAAELLHEDAQGGEARLSRIVIDNAGRLERIVSDVLQLGRRDQAHRESIDLGTFLPAFLAEFSAGGAASLPPAEIHLESVAQTLLFDRAHLHQVLWNLLSNAVRHAEGGAAKIELALTQAGDALELHVRDHGPGIPAELRGQVFEPFFTTHHEGTGLGLYIARELCEANGARLELRDDASGVPGAHFCIVGRSG